MITTPKNVPSETQKVFYPRFFLGSIFHITMYITTLRDSLFLCNPYMYEYFLGNPIFFAFGLLWFRCHQNMVLHLFFSLSLFFYHCTLYFLAWARGGGQFSTRWLYTLGKQNAWLNLNLFLWFICLCIWYMVLCIFMYDYCISRLILHPDLHEKNLNL